MTIPVDKEIDASENTLLTLHEHSICTYITSCESPHNKRAQALLLLNEHNTQGQAAAQTGLSTGQIKYWLAKFRKQRLTIFPDILLNEIAVEKINDIVEPVAESKTENKPEFT